MKLRYEKVITRAMLRAEPETLFVFGDNLEQTGFGGQAKEMRDEPNAVGIPTKRSPGMEEKDFFTDADLQEARAVIFERFIRLRDHILVGGAVVWPAYGIGTGLAQLPHRAPGIWTYVEMLRRTLEVMGAMVAGEGVEILEWPK